jgi:hypothetical protein
LAVAIKATFPWLWQLKELMAERPNLVPTGLGNNSDIIDMSDFLPTPGDGGGAGTAFEPLSDGVDDLLDMKGETTSSGAGDEPYDDEDDEVMLTMPTKRQGLAEENKTAARPRISKPSGTQQNPKKLKTAMIERFSEQVKAEEATAQKALELKMEKVKAMKEKDLAKIKAQTVLKTEKLRIRGQLEEKRMELAFRRETHALPSSTPNFTTTFAHRLLPPEPLPDHHAPPSSPALTGYENSLGSTLPPLTAHPDHIPNTSASASRSTSTGYESSQAASVSFGGSLYDSFRFDK